MRSRSGSTSRRVMAAQDEPEIGFRRRDGVTILDLRGEIDAATADGMSHVYAEATEAGAPTLVLNFADTTYINSTGIAALVELLSHARERDQRVIACGLTDHYREIFEITRLADFMTLTDDEEAAIGAAAPRPGPTGGG